MSSCSAASRREAPPSTCAITSMRMSAEYAFGIVRPQTNQCRQTRPFTGPWESCDSIRPEHALVALHPCWRFVAMHEYAFDAVDRSSTGTAVPLMWALLTPPRVGRAEHGSGQ